MFTWVRDALVMPLNHVLDSAPWARERLLRFAGRTAEFRVFPFVYRLTVTAEGRAEAPPTERVADTTVTLTPPLALRILSGDEEARSQARFDGDAEFAREISYLAENLRWDYEEDLSRIVGDVVAHRIGQTARDLAAWRRQAVQNLGENFRDYWVDERPMIAPRQGVEEFSREVDRLRDAVERLEKRIERLGGRPDSPP